MVDKISKEKRSKVMSAIRSKNTKPELALRRALWAQGFRYRIHYGEEKIDIAFPKKKLAIFIDGCFWHKCPIHGHIPQSNIKYWKPKLERNAERDQEKNDRLLAKSWTVFRIWEHELDEIEPIILKIKELLKLKENS